MVIGVEARQICGMGFNLDASLKRPRIMYSDYYHTAHFGVQLFFCYCCACFSFSVSANTLYRMQKYIPTRRFTIDKHTHTDQQEIKQFVPLLWPFISTHILTLYPLTPSHVCITYVYPNLTSRQHAQLTNTEHKMKQYSSKTTSRSSFSFTS